nr:hypothetical protein [Desulfobacula sp.]
MGDPAHWGSLRASSTWFLCPDLAVVSQYTPKRGIRVPDGKGLSLLILERNTSSSGGSRRLIMTLGADSRTEMESTIRCQISTISEGIWIFGVFLFMGNRLYSLMLMGVSGDPA